jgi:glycosyltransferase involved in cell wall biosynthesis
MDDRVDVLLSTFNGARFLAGQIESVLAQTWPHLRLLVRDDGSTDGTQDLIGRYAAAHPGKVVQVAGGNKLGPCGNFAALLAQSDAPYMMFCDQDDVWLADRVAIVLRRMKELEAELGGNCPLLVHTDLAVVDESLRPISGSFWKYQHFSPRRGATLNRLLIQNVVTGCAAMLNRALAQKALPIPAEAVVHDWWLALVAAAFGRIEHMDKATVLYRQHGSNLIGAARWGLAHLARKAMTFFDRSQLLAGLRTSGRQAQAFFERFGPELRPAERAAVRTYARLGECGFCARRWHLVRYGFYRSGWIRNLSLFARI